jgi:transposase
MTSVSREVRNSIIFNLQSMPISQKAIGELVDLSQQMVSTILEKFRKNVSIAPQKVGAKCRLSAENLKELPVLLEKGTDFHGFEGAYWTHARVGIVIKEQFNVSYENKQVGRILKQINWTWQKPQKKDAQQDLAKVEKWKTTDLPALKKKAIDEDYDIYYHDEATVQLCANVVKTYSPRGKTPILALHDTKGYQYVCIASSISEAGKLFYQIRDNSFKGEGIIEYLKSLLATTHRKILLIWDNAKWHKSQNVIDFLNTELGKRLWVANTPPYSPECNPDELVWANLKKVQIPNRVAKNVKELKIIAHKGMSKIQESVELVQSFFNSENFYFTT